MVDLDPSQPVVTAAVRLRKLARTIMFAERDLVFRRRKSTARSASANRPTGCVLRTSGFGRGSAYLSLISFSQRRLMKRLVLTLLLCAGPVWGQAPGDSVLRRQAEYAFRLGFKAGLAQACGELSKAEYDAVVRRFTREAEYVGTIFAGASSLPDRFGAGEALAHKGFVGRNGLALCRVWAPESLAWLRAIAGGTVPALPP